MPKGQFLPLQLADRPFLQIADSRRKRLPHTSHRHRARVLTCASIGEGQPRRAQLFGLDIQPFSAHPSRPGSESSTDESSGVQSFLLRAVDALRGQSAALRQTAAAAAVGMVLLAGLLLTLLFLVTMLEWIPTSPTHTTATATTCGRCRATWKSLT